MVAADAGASRISTRWKSACSDGERVLDRRRTAFGIREVKPVLTDPATGEKRFRFDVNGRPVFLRGGNWVPLEGATHVWQPDRARDSWTSRSTRNMNMLRIWGEGVIPPQSFYDECDRRGICVWQDFMFGYLRPRDRRHRVPGELPRRDRRHDPPACAIIPPLLLWCGGNEQYLWTPTANVSDAKRKSSSG